MSRPTNDTIILNHKIAMQARANTAALFIATRRRKLSVQELTRIILTAMQP